MSEKRKFRCAIYTQKSSEEGLEQAFNSLDAQREACAAHVASQRREGWVLAKERYDDCGISGGTLERPALQRLLGGIEAGRIDCVVAYEVDRLTRSLADFAKLVERFDRVGASFDSATQSFNTATGMGRIDPALLSIDEPISMRKRGVETRIVLGAEPAEIDHKLIERIISSIRWMDEFRTGASTATIANREAIPL